jgi:hypothetical protein
VLPALKADAPFAELFSKVKEAGLIDCVCKACSAKLGSMEDAKKLGLNVSGTMMGRTFPTLDHGRAVIYFRDNLMS